MLKKSLYISIIIILTLLFNISSRAETVDQIQAKIDAANRSRAQLEAEISKYQEQLKDVGAQATTLQNTIKSLDISANKITTEVKLVESNIGTTEYTIKDTGEKIIDKQTQISRGNMAIRQSLRQIYEADDSSVWEVLLSNSDLSSFWDDLENTIRVQARVSDLVASVKDIKASLEQAKSQLEKKKKELENYNNELNGKKQVLQSTKKEKNTMLVVTKSTEANYQKILKDKLALKQALDQEINSYESQLKLIIDPKSFPPAGKGILTWPLDNIFITQNFGKTTDSGRLYVSGTHNGADFRASIGTRVMSAGTGVVEAIGNTDLVCPGASYGKWVFIRYDNGLASIYGHLSVVSAVVGKRVKSGDVVGYSGNTGYSTGPHLHMGLYAGQGVKVSTLKSIACKGTYTIPLADTKAYLDPLVYL
jgi:murein DD-endopeptidase MepM/ murein hydrolase activator NlpD